jgi:NTP pyrophosphatase (non-canonical NTP hydrolase)
MQRTTEQLINDALKLERPPIELDDNTLSGHEVLLAVIHALNTPHMVWVPSETPDVWDRVERFRHNTVMPNDYEQYLLTMLVEECAEVAQRATKALRFGLNETQPDQPYDNSVRLAHEIGDLLGVASMMVRALMVSRNTIDSSAFSKPFRMERFR